jgi:hypothetical protein
MSGYITSFGNLRIERGRAGSRAGRRGCRAETWVWGRALIALALATITTSCGDSCSSYSSFSCKQIEAAEYNVYFFFPSDHHDAARNRDGYFLGRASGLGQCGNIARRYAASKKVLERKD